MLTPGRSPGFGLVLVAETLNGFLLGTEMSSTPQGQGDAVLPEDLGRNCAGLLLEEIYRVRRTLSRGRSGGFWDRFHFGIRFQRLTFWRKFTVADVTAPVWSRRILLPSRFSRVGHCSRADQNSWGIPARGRQEARSNPSNNDGFSLR